MQVHQYELVCDKPLKKYLVFGENQQQYSDKLIKYDTVRNSLYLKEQESRGVNRKLQKWNMEGVGQTQEDKPKTPRFLTAAEGLENQQEQVLTCKGKQYRYVPTLLQESEYADEVVSHQSMMLFSGDIV